MQFPNPRRRKNLDRSGGNSRQDNTTGSDDGDDSASKLNNRVISLDTVSNYLNNDTLISN